MSRTYGELWADGMVATGDPPLSLSVVIPAHNEERNILPTLEELEEVLDARGVRYELVVVDDNSTDGTAQLLDELRALREHLVVVHREPPRGFGRAVRSGLAAVTGDVVVLFMADRSDDPYDVVRYLEKIEEGYDCVFGSRFVRGSRVRNYPTMKLVVNRLVNTGMKWLYRCPFNDLSNAFKAYRTEVIRACQPYQACHFNITIEMSLGALNRRFSVAQIPISWNGRTWGVSNLRLREMGRRYLQTLLKAYSERLLISDDLMADAGRSRDQVPIWDRRADEPESERAASRRTDSTGRTAG